jgi:hypothetical protein
LHSSILSPEFVIGTAVDDTPAASVAQSLRCQAKLGLTAVLELFGLWQSVCPTPQNCNQEMTVERIPDIIVVLQ